MSKSGIGTALQGLLGCAILATGADQRRPRVFVPDSESWSFGGGFSIDDEFSTGSVRGGAKPQTAEIIKTIHERCPEAIVTRHEEKADYVLLLQHEGGKVFVRKDNKYVLFDSEATRSRADPPAAWATPSRAPARRSVRTGVVPRVWRWPGSDGPAASPRRGVPSPGASSIRRPAAGASGATSGEPGPERRRERQPPPDRLASS